MWSACSALECYQTMSQDKFDIAAVDVGLPDQNGFVLAEYIRSNTDMNVILLIAMGEPEDRVKGYESGADIYFVKPVKCRSWPLQSGVSKNAGPKTALPGYTGMGPGGNSIRSQGS